MERSDRRAPVQGTRHLGRGTGTVAWSEHVAAWEIYRKYRGDQSAERVTERGGFDYGELVVLLGAEPETWRARDE
uniref:Uncharacterized protein n=1 Tax=viral metagenome TaxID=1070528 RepID=A0A6M3LMY8_9ZZZZ